MGLNRKALSKLLDSLSKTLPEEIDCGTCFQELDRFVDMLKEGKEPAQVLPLVQHHLAMCDGCHEEMQALVSALKAVEG